MNGNGTLMSTSAAFAVPPATTKSAAAPSVVVHFVIDRITGSPFPPSHGASHIYLIGRLRDEGAMSAKLRFLNRAGGGNLGERQFDREFRTLSRPAFDVDPAVVAVDDPLDEAQAKADAIPRGPRGIGAI